MESPLRPESASNAAFTPAQLVAGNMMLVARNKLRVARNLLRWCKRGITEACKWPEGETDF